MKYIATLLLTCLSLQALIAQNDCEDALIVCGNMGYTGLNATGFGVQELNDTNTCESAENNSLWLQLPINTGGTLGFTLIPESSNINVDFDFFIFGPDVTCGNLGQAIRCSTTNPTDAFSDSNHTGMNEMSEDTSEGPGPFGDNFVQWLTVEAGDVYYLVIDRPVGSSDFSITWTGTATFYDAPVYNNPEGISLDLSQCDSDDADDQSTQFDLTAHHDMLRAGQQFATLTYHEDLNDVITGDNAIANPEEYANTSNPQTIYMRMTNTITGCFETETFELEITNPVVAGEPMDLSLCDFEENGLQEFNLAQNDELIKDGNTTAAVTYYTSQANAQQEVDPLPVLYQNATPYATQTIWARIENTEGCYGHAITSFTLSIIPLPEIVYELDTTDFNGNSNAVSIVMPDPENYEFSLDNGTFSDMTVFEGLSPGPYTITIRAKNGCGSVTEEIVLLDYPRYFSPNGDGKNDNWQIPFLTRQSDATLTVYDRYGKVVGAFKGGYMGWDGNFEGQKLPATDYWFVLQLNNGRTVKGHFAMIR